MKKEKFIESYNKNLINMENSKSNKLLILNCVLLFNLYENTDNLINNKLIKLFDSMINNAYSGIYRENYLLDLKFNLLNGKYSISDDYVCIISEFGNIQVKIADLVKACINCYTNYCTIMPQTKFVVTTDPNFKYSIIKSLNDLENTLSTFKVVEFIDKPIHGIRNEEYNTKVEGFINVTTEYDGEKYPDLESKFTYYFNLFKSMFNNNIDFKYKITEFSGTNVFNYVRDLYISDKNLFLNHSNDLNWLVDLVQEFYNNKLLYYYENLQRKFNLKNKYLDGNYKDKTIVESIVSFYTMYSDLLLDREFSLKEIINNDYFDYSKLKLDAADDGAMDVYNICNFSNYLAAWTKKYEIAFSDFKKVFNQYSEDMNNKKLAKILKEKRTNLNYIEKLYNSISNISYDMHYIDCKYNYSIIKHMINAIKTGNVKKISIDEDINNTILEFSDYLNGNLTYKCDIKYSDFIELMSKYNCDIINSYFKDNTLSKRKKLI